MSMDKLARSIPHEVRNKILFTWLPRTKPSMADPNYEMLFETYFVYIEPDGIKKTNCPVCLGNILENWKHLEPYIAAAEKEYNEFEML